MGGIITEEVKEKNPKKSKKDTKFSIEITEVGTQDMGGIIAEEIIQIEEGTQDMGGIITEEVKKESQEIKKRRKISQRNQRRNSRYRWNYC